jgi:hypothetical protein
MVNKMNDRKYYIDNLRWFWILLLIPFHAAMAWNCWEGNYIWFCENRILSSLVIFISPWFMPLLFVLAGISARYALNRRSYKQFALERVKKLLIPLISGVLTVVAFIAYMADKYFNNYDGNFLEHYQVFFTNISDLTGYDGYFTPGHLWFLLYLFIISMVSLLIITLQRKIFPKLSFGKFKTFLLPVLMVFPLIMTPVLDFGGKSIGENLALFLLGYYILSEENILEKLTKYRFAYLIIMLICDVTMVYLFVWKGKQTGIIVSVCSICTLWFGILGFLGLARCKFNQNNSFTQYMSHKSFMIYIFHFGWLVTIQYYLSKSTLNTVLLYIISITATLAFTLITCEIMNRVPVLRCFFGEKGRKVTSRKEHSFY